MCISETQRWNEQQRSVTRLTIEANMTCNMHLYLLTSTIGQSQREQNSLFPVQSRELWPKYTFGPPQEHLLQCVPLCWHLQSLLPSSLIGNKKYINSLAARFSFMNMSQ